MNKETYACPTCKNICEVKISSGHNNPKNKGRKYISCPKCPQSSNFSWVETPLDEAWKLSDKIKAEEAKYAPATPQKPVEVREPVQQDVPAFKPRDYEAENRGKVRHGLLVARTELVGLVEMTPDEFDVLNQLTEIIMTGKFPSLEDVELPSDFLKRKNKDELDSSIGQLEEK